MLSTVLGFVTMQNAMNQVWRVPFVRRPSFLQARLRSLALDLGLLWVALSALTARAVSWRLLRGSIVERGPEAETHRPGAAG